MRQVKILEWKQSEEDNNRFEKVWSGKTGVFHQFGTGSIKFESSTAMYTTAIVELNDGTIECVEAGLIQFVVPYLAENEYEYRRKMPTIEYYLKNKGNNE